MPACLGQSRLGVHIRRTDRTRFRGESNRDSPGPGSIHLAWRSPGTHSSLLCNDRTGDTWRRRQHDSRCSSEPGRTLPASSRASRTSDEEKHRYHSHRGRWIAKLTAEPDGGRPDWTSRGGGSGRGDGTWECTYSGDGNRPDSFARRDESGGPGLVRIARVHAQSVELLIVAGVHARAEEEALLVDFPINSNIEKPDHHLGPCLLTPGHCGFGIGIVRIGSRVVEGSSRLQNIASV